jgi:GGDEF domain-containing protein
VSEDPLDPRRADRLTRAAQAAQALSETLWEALHEELIDPHSQRVVELSEQLADVSKAVASLARVDTRPPAPAQAPPTATPTTTVGGASDRSVAPEPSVAPVQPGSVEPSLRSARTVHHAPSKDSAQPREPSAESDAVREPLSRAVLIDELAPAAPEPLGVQSPPQIEIRDVRGVEGPAAWIGSIGRRLERHEQDGSPFAVLLVELMNIERTHRTEPSGEISGLTGHVEDAVEEALARELHPADSLTREGPGRYWLLASQTNATGAQMLVERIARAVRSSTSHRGMPLEVAVGIAVCPDDGLRASELAAHADVGLYVARAAGESSIE